MSQQASMDKIIEDLTGSMLRNYLTLLRENFSENQSKKEWLPISIQQEIKIDFFLWLKREINPGTWNIGSVVFYVKITNPFVIMGVYMPFCNKVFVVHDQKSILFLIKIS